MPSIMLTPSGLSALKRAVRVQLPNVKNTHLLEALARGFGFNTCAALNTALSNVPAGTTLAADLSMEAVVARLAEFGYPEAEASMSLFPEAAMRLLANPAVESHQISRSRERSLIPMATVFVSATLDGMEAQGAMSAEHGATIRTLLERRSVILITGQIGSGKSTMMRALMPGMAAHVSRGSIGLVQHAREFEQLPVNVTEIFRDQTGRAPRRYITSAGDPAHLSDYDTFFVDEVTLHDPQTDDRILSAWRQTRVGLGTANMHHPFANDRVLEVIDAIIYMQSEGRQVQVKDVTVLSDQSHR